MIPADLHRWQSASADVTEDWMGDSRGWWKATRGGNVGNYNDKMVDMAGDFHSDALRGGAIPLTDRDTLRYGHHRDTKVFTKPWTISLALHRPPSATGVRYVSGRVEEANGAFTEGATWFRATGHRLRRCPYRLGCPPRRR